MFPDLKLFKCQIGKIKKKLLRKQFGRFDLKRLFDNIKEML